MIRIGVCDDDIKYLKNIKKVIADSYKRVSTGGTKTDLEFYFYDCGEMLLKEYLKVGIDVVFLDIECGSMNGFDIAKELEKLQRNPGIVYISNYDSYVTKAFVCRPIDFLPKSKINTDIDITMCKILDYIKKERASIVFNNLKTGQIINIRVSNIRGIDVYKHSLEISMTTGNITIESPLSPYEQVLVMEGFIKLRRGCYVNSVYINKILSDRVILDNGEEKFIAKRKKKQIEMAWLEALF